MLLIGEVSKITQVSLRMLRYYDENSIFVPRIIKGNGYRYYSASQLDDLYKIIELRDLGFSVAQIGEMIHADNKEKYLSAVQEKKIEIEKEIDNLQQRIKRLKSLEDDAKKSKKDFLDEKITIVLKSIPDKNVISYRKNVANYFCEGDMWKDFEEKLKFANMSFSNESFSLYHDDDYREENVDIELCTVVESEVPNVPDELNYRQVDGCNKAVSILIKGPYSNISSAYLKFAHWLEEHEEYRMSGPTRQICHVSPVNSKDPEEYITELLIPLKD